MKPQGFDTAGYVKLPNTDINPCFGCSPINKSGLRMEFYSDMKNVFSYLAVHEHMCGWSNLVHGGIIATILDEIMSWSAIYLMKTIILTKTIEVAFLKPVQTGDQLQAVGSIKKIISDREAEMTGELYNSQEELCARSNGTFALFTSEFVRKKGILDISVIDFFERIMKASLDK